LNFIFRRKILAIKDALEKFGGRVIYCDSDTFFVKHPKKAFARVRPGHTIMHVAEYHVADPCARRLADCLAGRNLKTRGGSRWNITPTTPMFNAGVVGLHEAEMSLLDDVVHLADQLHPHCPHPEQFSFGVCFSRSTKLHQAYDIIHHYWTPDPRALFREHLVRVLHGGGLSDEEKFRLLWAKRPRLSVRPFQMAPPGLPRRLAFRVRSVLSRAAERAGVKEPLKQAVQRIIGA
jgi:hypothetical protein